MRVSDDALTPPKALVYMGSGDLFPKPLLDAAGISNLGLILADSAQKTPPAHLFGIEPPHTWCYFFEKADLARQVEDYAQSYSLFKQASESGYYPQDLTEWYPFIDSALHLGYFNEAAELSNNIIVNDSVVKYGVCRTWQNYLALLPAGSEVQKQAEDQISLMECSITE